MFSTTKVLVPPSVLVRVMVQRRLTADAAAPSSVLSFGRLSVVVCGPCLSQVYSGQLLHWPKATASWLSSVT